MSRSCRGGRCENGVRSYLCLTRSKPRPPAQCQAGLRDTGVALESLGSWHLMTVTPLFSSCIFCPGFRKETGHHSFLQHRDVPLDITE